MISNLPLMGKPCFIIHHITDVHVGNLHYSPELKFSFLEPSNSARNIKLYRSHLNKLSLGVGDLPDIVVLSGDLTSIASEEEMNLVADEIRGIVNIIEKKNVPWRKEINAPFFLIVPGNHDLDWNKSVYEEKIERYARMSQSLYQDGKVLSVVYHGDRHEVYADFGDTCNIFIYLLNTTTLSGVIDPGLSSIHQTLKNAYTSALTALSSRSIDAYSQALKELQDEARKDPGYVSHEHLDNLNKAVENIPKHRFKIAVMHHNPSSIPSDDIEAYDTIINAGVVKQVLMEAGFELVLHGHRHFQHSASERYLNTFIESQNRLVIVGGDSIGCKDKSPFLEIRIYDSDHAHSYDLPACAYSIDEYENDRGTYRKVSQKGIHEVAARQILSDIREILPRIGRPVRDLERKESIEIINRLAKPIQAFQSQLVDWGETSTNWIAEFHFQLSNYNQIFATDIYPRSSIGTPSFERYLREQYSERIKRLSLDDKRTLRFSKPVYRAIMNTGWQPDAMRWDGYELEDCGESHNNDLEIVRILIRPESAESEIVDLENLNFDHKNFAVPLFVIRDSELDTSSMLDFAIGVGENKKILRGYVYNANKGQVVEIKPNEGYRLAGRFRDLLNHKGLKTVDQELGTMVMIRSPKSLRNFAGDYDNTRKASPAILETLRTHLSPNREKVGLDIGCGTGNYTIPFADNFKRVIGLDILGDMLEVAKKKSDKVEWIQGNAMNCGLPEKFFDAIWAISTLHYFAEVRQKFLFKEIFHKLKPKGVFVADTEFAEQHASLWLVEYFPSLRKRYKNAVFSTQIYKQWLLDIGFNEVKFESLTYDPNQPDKVLRIGQHQPELYLDDTIRKGIPAFVEMRANELNEGLERLGEAIKDETINKVIDDYLARATMKGDVGFIIAIR